MVKNYMIFAIYILATVLINSGSAKEPQETIIAVSGNNEPPETIDPSWAEVVEPTKKQRNHPTFGHYTRVIEDFNKGYKHVIILFKPDVCPEGNCPGITAETDVGLYFEKHYETNRAGDVDSHMKTDTPSVYFEWFVPWRKNTVKGKFAKVLIEILKKSIARHNYKLPLEQRLNSVPQWPNHPSAGFETRYESHLVCLTKIDTKMYVTLSEKLVSDKLKQLGITASEMLTIVLNKFLPKLGIFDYVVERQDSKYLLEKSQLESKSADAAKVKTAEDDQSLRREELIGRDQGEPLAPLKTQLEDKFSAVIEGFVPSNAPSDMIDELKDYLKYNGKKRDDKEQVELVTFELNDPGNQRYLHDVENSAGDKKAKNDNAFFPRIYAFEKENLWAKTATPTSVSELRQIMNYYFPEQPNFIVSTIKKLVGKADQVIGKPITWDSVGQNGAEKIIAAYSIFLIDWERPAFSGDLVSVMDNLSKLKGHPDLKGHIIFTIDSYTVNDEKYFGLIKKVKDDVMTDVISMLVDMWEAAGQSKRAEALKNAAKEARKNNKTKSNMFPCVLVFNGSELIGTLWPQSASEMRQVVSGITSDNLDVKTIVDALMDSNGSKSNTDRNKKPSRFDIKELTTKEFHSQTQTTRFTAQYRGRQTRPLATATNVANPWQNNRQPIPVGAA